MKPIVLSGLLLTNMVARGQTPTWHEDIACIVYTHCTPCHHEGGAGHFSLTSYTDAALWRNEMKAATQVRYMPPWPPDPAYRAFAHERRLSQQEIDLIAAWVDGGYPEGDPAAALPTPTYTDEPELVDAEISTIMEDFVIPPSSTDLYRCFVLTADNPVDRFITALEVVPGNRSMVHHVLVFEDITGQARQLDQNDPGPGYTSFGGIGIPSAKLLGAWVPGQRTFHTAPGMGIRLRANADLVIQVHYPPTGDVEVDSTRVNLRMSSDASLRNLSIDPVLRHFSPILQNGPFVIPAGQVRTFHTRYTVPANITATGVAPHAHLVCTSMRSYAVTPSGDTIRLIDIPRWDFNWQGFYDFRNPVFIPAGSQLHGFATYDNTVNNPRNPNNPPQTVTAGEATTDEMMLFYFAYTPGSAADTLIVVDDGSGSGYYMDCDAGVSVGQTTASLDQWRVWPIPSPDGVFLQGPGSSGWWSLWDAMGRKVLEGRTVLGVQRLDRGKLASGTYVLQVADEHGRPVHRTKLILE